MGVALDSGSSGIRRLARVCAAVLTVAMTGALPAPANAQNLLTNGSFDGVNGTAGSAWAGCVGCWNGSTYTLTQQLDGSTNNSVNTATGGLLTGWTMTNPTGNFNSNYTFILTASQATSGFAGNQLGLSLGGTIGASPNGGNFLAMDGGYELQSVYQTIGGLTPGATYVVSFSWGAAQQLGASYNQPVTDSWLVGFDTTAMSSAATANGTTIKSTSSMTAGSLVGGSFTPTFSGWTQSQMSFVASSTSMVLSFLAQGSPAGQPPFSLLDGVSLTRAVPEPATSTLMLCGLAGLLGLRGKRRRA